MTPQEASLQTLQTLVGRREAYRPLLARLWGDLCGRYVPATGAMLEIGAGLGALLDFLPRTVVQRLVLSEPHPSASAILARVRPGRVLEATAESLPLAARSMAGVLGLCVLDVIEDVGRVARELHRVLEPGAHVVHVLDMTTDRGPVLRTIVESHHVPFPNVFSDPLSASWPEDMVLVQRDRVERVRDILAAMKHPLTTLLDGYLSPFLSEPFRQAEAVAVYQGMADVPTRRVLMRRMLEDAWQAAGEGPETVPEFRATPVSSARAFETRLRAGFNAATGFEVVLSDILATAAAHPCSGGKPRYRNRRVGHEHEMAALPERRFDGAAVKTSGEESVTECGVFAFVARRARASQ